MGMLCAVSGMVGFVGAIFFLAAHQHRAVMDKLHQFAGRLERGRVTGGEGWLGGLSDVEVTGRLDGHEVRLGFRIVGSGKHQQTHTCFRVEVPNAVTNFEVKRASTLRRFGRWLGLVDDVAVGDKRIDDKYILSGHSGSLSELFGDRELEKAVDCLLEDFDAVQVHFDQLEAEQVGEGSDPRQLLGQFRNMIRLAKLCERRRVNVKVLGSRSRFAWTGGGERARCPYCRDDLKLEGPDVSACSRCDTLHHRECMEEAGGCTIFGCGGRASVRA